MPEPDRIFHLAIPCRDVAEARRFYVEVLGCREARSYADRVTLDFWGVQLVCHVAPDRLDGQPTMYPRHFGFTMRDEAEFLALRDRLRAHGAPFFRNIFIRFEGRRERHRAFFVRDPSNNLIEFKHY
ncbi:MAG: VOC family protein, partial [Planctomycetota bacterium]